ncbi:hypothetical protein Hanom_Chr08g00719491 [Helianthus anomalus]
MGDWGLYYISNKKKPIMKKKCVGPVGKKCFSSFPELPILPLIPAFICHG